MKMPVFFDKLKPREKKILYVTAALLLVMIGYHGILRPLTDKMASLDDGIFAMELRLRKAKILIRQREEIMDEAKKFPNLEQLNAGTDEEETARMLSLMEQTARKTGCSLSDVKPLPVKTDKFIKRFEVELTAEAVMEQLVNFVYELEHSALLLKVERAVTSPKEGNSSTVRAQLTVVRQVTK